MLSFFYEIDKPDELKVRYRMPEFRQQTIPFRVQEVEYPLEPEFYPGATLTATDLGNYNPLVYGSDLTPFHSRDLSCKVSCFSGGIDLSLALVSMDTATGVGKTLTGSASFRCNPGLSPGFFGRGMAIQVVMTGRGNTKSRVAFDFVVIQEPKVSASNGITTVTVSLGSQGAAWNEEDKRRLYCGLPPKNPREMATILAGQFGYEMGASEDGHTLEETLEDQGFRGIAPIVDAYAVTNRDVWEDFNGRLRVQPRPKYRDFYHLGVDNFITLDWNAPETPLNPVVRVQNSYTSDLGYPERVERSYSASDNYDVANTNPWFKGGYTETFTSTYYEGSTVVKVVSEVYGRIPNSWPVLDSALPQDACAINSVPTTYGLIYTETVENLFTPLYMDKQALWKTEKQVEGLAAIRQEIPGPTVTVQWDFVNGAISRETTLYKNQVDDNKSNFVCAHQQPWLQTQVERWTFATLSNQHYGLQSYRKDHWVKAQDLDGLDRYTRFEDQWAHTWEEGKYLEANGKWVKTKSPEPDFQAPATAVFRLPLTREIKVSGTYFAESVGREPGTSLTLPLECPTGGGGGYGY